MDIRTPEGLEAVIDNLDATCGLDRLTMVHLNDSRAPLGSNRDRHENIGEGEIGQDAFRALLRHPVFAQVPGILEVPGFDGHGPDRRNMDILRELSGRHG